MTNRSRSEVIWVSPYEHENRRSPAGDAGEVGTHPSGREQAGVYMPDRGPLPAPRWCLSLNGGSITRKLRGGGHLSFDSARGKGVDSRPRRRQRVTAVGRHEPTERRRAKVRNRERREIGKEQMVRVHYDEGAAIHIGPESCAGGREAVREALTGESARPSSRPR